MSSAIRPLHKKRVAYFYDDSVGMFNYGEHPMKPFRIMMTHELITNYKLFRKMEVFRPHRLSEAEFTVFHSDDYVSFLQKVTCDNQNDYETEIKRFNFDNDCPVFDGLFNFCQIYAGGSVNGAYKLNRLNADIVINWSGGLHHAKKSEASGFCYVNDIVLAIIELLKFHGRVLYIDIDIHHGDGVEEAFYTTDRVLTVSFHKYGEFFPGTGAVGDFGCLQGKYYSLNFPLDEGVDDDQFIDIFKSLIEKVMEWYQPGAVVLQCGADSLAGDRLGCFNLSLKAHSFCVDFINTFHLPTLILGGGGYTLRNVARCWAYETARCVDITLTDPIPAHEYHEYYGPDFKIDVPLSNMDNLNTADELAEKKRQIFEILRKLPHAPSVQYHHVPDTPTDHVQENLQQIKLEKDPDVRITQREQDKMLAHESEFFDGGKDHDTIPPPMNRPKMAPFRPQPKLVPFPTQQKIYYRKSPNMPPKVSSQAFSQHHLLPTVRHSSQPPLPHPSKQPSKHPSQSSSQISSQTSSFASTQPSSHMQHLRASMQASMHASMQASMQASTQASAQVSKQVSSAASSMASLQAHPRAPARPAGRKLQQVSVPLAPLPGVDLPTAGQRSVPQKVLPKPPYTAGMMGSSQQTNITVKSQITPPVVQNGVPPSRLSNGQN